MKFSFIFYLICTFVLFNICTAIECGEGIECTLDGEGTLTISGSGEMTNYTKDVRPEWWSAIEGCSVKKIVVGAEISHIGSYSFADCLSLSTIEWADENGGSVRYIGPHAFYNCSSLTTIVIPNNVEEIHDNTFMECSKLANVDLKNVKRLDSNAFAFCTSLTEITLTASVMDYPNDKNYNGIAHAFRGCSHLAEFKVAEGNGYYAVADSGVLFSLDKKSLFAYPAGRQGTEYTTPEETVRIENYAFSNSQLKKVVMKNGGSNGEGFVGVSAFEYNTKLEEISIPNGVKSMKGYAFDGCSSLLKVELPDSVTGIGKGFFYGCKKLNEVKLSNGMTWIMHDTFYDCESLETVIMPSGLTDIKSAAFRGCISLKSITLPSTVNTIENNAFHGCISLTTVNYEGTPETEIKTYDEDKLPFSGCSKLTSICVEKGYKFEKFCEVIVSKTCKPEPQPEPEPTQNSQPSGSILNSIPSKMFLLFMVVICSFLF